ncbi:MAG: integration host factor subunit beta [Albidovulum sp.]|nr:integration host factor subunit beta [Albidovulum sp.]MDE0304445.1 integration host factor subunit beta [Albidovulum sp.]MDE0533229.1 integration host factor subunit beta [Albidovulum sp.]
MVRSELIEDVAERHPNLQIQEVRDIVDCIFTEMKSTLRRGDRVELRGFGSFSVKIRESRVARNPRNEEPVYVPQKSVIHFKSGKLMHERLNDTQ